MTPGAETVPAHYARPDTQLISEIADGNVAAFEELYRRYCGRAYGLARSVCGDDGHAEDAVQEAFVSIWRSCATYRLELGTVAPWVLSVVRYRAIDIARRNTNHNRNRAAGQILEWRPAPVDVAAQALARADAPGLLALLGRLPDAQREVITLAFFGELTHAEIASRLDLPAGTVKGRMRLGLQKLRGQLDRAAA